MHPFEYHKVSPEEIESLGSVFCSEHGDDARGIIADSEYDRLFDHLAESLRTHGTFTEDSGKADFSGCRYVDQIPWITIVSRTAEPCVALSAALSAINTSHRPMAVSFDFYPDSLLVLPPNRVFTTFERDALTPKNSPRTPVGNE
jgi:hypothetical protein